SGLASSGSGVTTASCDACSAPPCSSQMRSSATESVTGAASATSSARARVSWTRTSPPSLSVQPLEAGPVEHVVLAAEQDQRRALRAALQHHRHAEVAPPRLFLVAFAERLGHHAALHDVARVLVTQA